MPCWHETQPDRSLPKGREMIAGTLSILTLAYGAESRQVKQFVAEIDQIRAEQNTVFPHMESR